jgi:hypothetical protein
VDVAGSLVMDKNQDRGLTCEYKCHVIHELAQRVEQEVLRHSAQIRGIAAFCYGAKISGDSKLEKIDFAEYNFHF